MTIEPINSGLTDEQRLGVVEALNTLLSDQYLIYTKTRNYHWNVVGPRFHDLHQFFEQQYTELAGMIDETAENTRQFGGFAAGTMKQFIELSRLKEEPGSIPDEDGMLKNLLSDHETVSRGLRQDVDRAQDECKAADAADFLTAQLEAHNKLAWMLRSMLGRTPGHIDLNRGADYQKIGNGLK
ncbi:MAG: DNA starvation/stationary phase protection protein [Bryobacteraceae bacterium]